MRLPLSAALAAIALTGCAHKPVLAVTDAWVRLPAVPGRPAAAYFTVHGGEAAETLIAVSCEASLNASMHRNVEANGGSDMRAVRSVTLAAGGAVRFAPGGLHVMLQGLSPSVKAGGTTALTVTFATGERIVAKADVVAAGAAPPQH